MGLDPNSSIVLRAMVRMMLADGKVVYPEIELIQRVYLDLTGEDATQDLLDEVSEEVRADRRSADEYLEQETAGWKASDRRALLRAACLVAIADEELVRDERLLLIRFGRALRLAAADVRTIHAELFDE
jgi:uncharacterized tellurite resistance protein B-like protein